MLGPLLFELASEHAQVTRDTIAGVSIADEDLRFTLFLLKTGRIFNRPVQTHYPFWQSGASSSLPSVTR